MKTKKNLITALKKLVTSFGGEAKSNNTVDLVDEFADVVAQGSDSSGALRASFTHHSGISICDKTIAEIYSAYSAGKYVYADLTGFPYYLKRVSETTCAFTNFQGSNIEGNNNGTSDRWEIIGKG